MPQYYRNSSLTWPQYLKAQAFVDDVKDGIRSAGKAISSKIDEQTDDIIASNEALAKTISSDLKSLGTALESGFEKMEYGMEEIADGIAGLRSDFNWAMSGLLHKLDIQNLLLRDIYVELRIPDFQKERRYYVEQGCKHYTNGLYQESLECLLKAEPLEKTDPFVLYSIGQIYLYQPDMIDLEKAQDYFTRACNYYVAEKKNKQAGESYFHAGIAAYLRRDDVNAPQFAKKASELYPELLEAFYNHARFLAVQGNDSGLMSLESAIRKDKNYASKVLADKDFSRISGQIKALLERLKEEARTNAESSIVCTEKLMDEYVIFDDHIKNEIKNEIHDLLCSVKSLFVKDCYFDYLECINKLRKMHDKIEEMTTNITIKEIRDLTGYFKMEYVDNNYKYVFLTETKNYEPSGMQVRQIAFSPDGLTLAIMFDHVIKLLQVHTGREIKNLRPTNERSGFCGMSVSHNGSIQAITMEGNTGGSSTMRLLDVLTGREIVTFDVKATYTPRCFFSPDGHTIAIYTDKKVELRETQTGRLIKELSASFSSVSHPFSSDGKILACLGDNAKIVQICDVQTAREIKVLNFHSSVKDMAFSPTALILAIGLEDGTLELWDLQTYRKIKVLRGIPKIFSPEGRILITADNKGLILWDMQTMREIINIYLNPKDAFNCYWRRSIAFSPDGLILAIGAENNLKSWLLISKVMSKLQSERLKHYENAARINKQQPQEEDETIKMQQKKWRSEGRCEVCGENLGFRLIPRTRCKKHL